MSVSVCIPTYNYGHLIGRAISSVLAQKGPVSEILVLDNASTDSTEKVVSQFSDNRLRYVRSSVNIGFAANLQRGLQLSNGDFVQFLCADDFLYPDYLSKTYALISSDPEIVFVHTGHHMVDREEKILEKRIYSWKKNLSGQAFLKQLAQFQISGVCLSSVLLRRRVLETAGGVDTDLDFIADYGMWLKLCVQGKVGYVPEALVGYRVHPGQATGIFIPGLKMRLAEKFMTQRKSFDAGPLEHTFLRQAFFQVFREWPKRRLAGACLKDLSAEAEGLKKKHPRDFPHFFFALFFLLSSLPSEYLKKMRLFYWKIGRYA